MIGMQGYTNWSLHDGISHHGGLQGYAQKETDIESYHSQYSNNTMNKSHAKYGFGQADYPNDRSTFGNQYFGYEKAAAMAEGGKVIGRANVNHKASHGMMIYEERTKVKGKFETGQFERINHHRSDDTSCTDSDDNSCSDSDDEYDEERRRRRGKYHRR